MNPVTAPMPPAPHGVDALGRLMAMVSAETGVQLPEAKRAMISSRLAKRLRQLDCDIDSYLAQVRKDPAEFTVLIDFAVTNHTTWWREGAHFDDFRTRLVAPLAQTSNPRLRVWCAACSTGEEAWSLALCLREGLRAVPSADASILATDISTRALVRAREGVYREDALGLIPPGMRELACKKVRPPPGASAVANPAVANPGERAPWRVRDELRGLVQFARLNLMGEWPMRGPFDAIFCRNVMIYFDTATQRQLIHRMMSLLRPGGTLYVGLSESLAGSGLDLRPIQPSVYVVP